MQGNIDKRTHGYKRRTEALLRKPDAVTQMLQNAIYAGFTADYVLMDILLGQIIENKNPQLIVNSSYGLPVCPVISKAYLII